MIPPDVWPVFYSLYTQSLDHTQSSFNGLRLPLDFPQCLNTANEAGRKTQRNVLSITVAENSVRFLDFFAEV